MDIREHSAITRHGLTEQPLAGQKALVTGAISGIGKAVAIALAEAGAAVAINCVVRDDDAHAVTDQNCAAGGQAIALRAEVSSEDPVDAMFDEACAEFGTLDIVVANAGLHRDAPFEELTLQQWNTVINVNLTAQFLCGRAAVREFLRRGRRPDVSRALGKIICMSSVHQVIPWAGHANYAASKSGVMMLVKNGRCRARRDYATRHRGNPTGASRRAQIARRLAQQRPLVPASRDCRLRHRPSLRPDPACRGNVDLSRTTDPACLERECRRLIQFPPGKGAPRWQEKDRLFLGVDNRSEFPTAASGHHLTGRAAGFGRPIRQGQLPMKPDPFSDALAFLLQPGRTTPVFWLLLLASVAVAGTMPEQRRLEHDGTGSSVC
jgi:NAD(P)-dependent dehydrogenase (short-subunit alcohol dehydrogenase family)